MKIYVIDNSRKIKKIKRQLEENFNVEEKENCKFKMTKNDLVIISDENGLDDGVEKLKNIVFLVCNKNYKYIWKLANLYKTVDIIDNTLDENYITTRIENLIEKGME